ncbi:MAG: FHA domain-containing protein, partial [Anaerolineales bacterium]|nr:FHA domain-containing protein [Anaerolineales bacterium]
MRREKRRAYEDPLTRPIQAVAKSPASARKKKSTSAKQPKPPVDAPACFVRFNADDTPAAAAPIPLSGPEITFGADPVQASHLLDDPSIAPLHARIKHTEDGEFILYDSGSIAGTWVNYEAITSEGYRLGHGDMVHFGQLIYRFYLSKPPEVFQPKVEPEHTTE